MNNIHKLTSINTSAMVHFDLKPTNIEKATTISRYISEHYQIFHITNPIVHPSDTKHTLTNPLKAIHIFNLDDKEHP
ncbi:hypothetical protein LX69_00609 [Breznakibacter xylanolyticus]|uniref:Uncharacterized protein n=1 Tax=Breznakibacter xylanolyticus TaxID=990 RepID=A0A2W7NKZ2_9BACT|nr:hypothetical protein [Breznakibacter xylanolyticus]PZX20153.1 hypothetical protein LX69_00609 [Breznakibacter xylanolyticus]